METHEILKAVKAGKISINDAKKLLSIYSIEVIEGFAKIDINRRKERGIPEVIFAETKELEDIKKIIEKLWKKSNSVNCFKIKENRLSKRFRHFAKK